MPLTRVEGDFSQISNIVQVTVPDVPSEPSMFLHVIFNIGDYYLFPTDLSGPVISNFVDFNTGESFDIIASPDLGVDGLPLLGVIGAALEASSVAGADSIDMGENFEFGGAPIFSSGSNRHYLLAYGDGIFFTGGADTAGNLTSAMCEGTFGNGAFSWQSLESAMYTSAVGETPNAGIAGVGFHQGYFYAYLNAGMIIRASSADMTEWEIVGTGGPSQTWVAATARPQAHFAGTGNLLVACFCGRIVKSLDGGATWDMVTFIDGITSENIVGANPPATFGMAYGGNSLVVTLTHTPNDLTAGFIYVMNIQENDFNGAWELVEPPFAATQTTRLLDVVYDSAGDRFIFLQYRFDETYGSTWRILTMDQALNVEVAFEADRDDTDDQFGYLAISQDVTYTPPVIQDFVEISNYTLVSYGGSGSGDQEPNILICFGAGTLAPLGQLYLGGGAMNTGFLNPLSISDDEGPVAVQDPDPLSNQRASYQPAGEWWFGEDPPDPSNYEVRIVPQLGSTDPAVGEVNTWIPLDQEPSWQYFGVFGPPASAVWGVQIRNVNTLQIVASATWNISQDVGT